MKIYPNPAGDKVTVELPEYLVVKDERGAMPSATVYHQWSSANLQVLDHKGAILSKQNVENNTAPLLLDVSGLKPGMYLFRLLYDEKEVTNAKVIIR